MSAFQVEARLYRAGDEALLLEGLERAARSGGGGALRELRDLRWRYGAAPHGACVALALDEEGRAVAGLCATRQRVRFEGGTVYWLEVGDLFNDFEHGAGLARARGLLAAGEALAEAFGGPAPEKHPVMYGVPNRRAHRLGLRRLEWEVLRSENELVLAPLSVPAPFSFPDQAEVSIQEPQRFPFEVERAFEAHAAGRAAILVRDAAYLNWRYAERPGQRFALALARRAEEPVGYAVLDEGRILDWAAAPADEPVARSLLAWAAARARAEGHALLTAVVPDTAPEWLLFQRLGFRVRGTREYLCFRSFQRPAIMSWLFQHWSYSRGDTLR